MKSGDFERHQKIKTMVAVVIVGLLVSGVLTVVLVMMGRGHPGL